MARYIDADKLEMAVLKPSMFDINKDDVIALISEQPTADVEKLIHGKWERREDGIFYWYACSNCHRKPLNNEYHHMSLSNYCPHCGAIMDGGIQE